MSDDLLKHRQVSFTSLHPDPHQAQTALLILSGLPGIVHHYLKSDICLHISYRIDRITLQYIEDLLQELGFHLDNSLMSKLKRALCYYTEETHRANLGCQPLTDGGNTRQVFIQQYQRKEHGCRDPRPHHWRIYR